VSTATSIGGVDVGHVQKPTVPEVEVTVGGVSGPDDDAQAAVGMGSRTTVLRHRHAV
jgi:hypothetical protein